MRQVIRRCASTLGLSVLSCAILVPVASAQSTASLNGTVKDATGAVITNTTVKLTNVNTAVSQTTEADGDMFFCLRGAPRFAGQAALPLLSALPY